jgi:hypothetical protein
MRLGRKFRRPAWQDDLATRVMAAALDSAVAKACWMSRYSCREAYI